MSNPRKGSYVSEENFSQEVQRELNNPVGSRLRIEESHGKGVANTFLKEPMSKYFFTIITFYTLSLHLIYRLQG